MAKPFAAFDVDGTIFKSSLAEKVVEGCIAAHVFNPEPFNKVYENRRRWQRNNNEGVYQAYLHRLIGTFVSEISGIEVERFNAVTETMITEHSVRKFAFPLKLMHATKNSHHIVAISGSPDILVQPFLAELPIPRIFGSTFEIENGVFTGNATSVGDKATILNNLVNDGVVTQVGSIAIGDTFSDIPMLGYADTAIMFNGSRTLTNYGTEFGWIRVNEVKDQITGLIFDDTLGVYTEQSVGSIIDNLAYRE